MLDLPNKTNYKILKEMAIFETFCRSFLQPESVPLTHECVDVA